MTEKEKAKELVDKIKYVQRGFVMPLSIAKQCALIAVDEILKVCDFKLRSFYQKVKLEIEKL